MTHSLPQRWLVEQHRLGHALCIVLDSENERPLRQALLKNSRRDQCLSVYSQTTVAELADAGPFIVTFDQPGDRHITELLTRPDSHWGWLASVTKGHLPLLVDHWRARSIIGERPHLRLYRFHDNRVLARALRHLSAQARPAYLGPAISVCYWQGTRWETTDNPAPGAYPVPDSPLWLQVPTPSQQALETRLTNARRFLLAEHVDAYAQLAEQRDPDAWLHATLGLAEEWGWQTPEQLAFLLSQSLQAPDHTLGTQWQMQPGENGDRHFERVRLMAAFWQGDSPL